MKREKTMILYVEDDESDDDDDDESDDDDVFLTMRDQESLFQIFFSLLIKIKQKTREQEDHQREPKTRILDDDDVFLSSLSSSSLRAFLCVRRNG